MVKIGKRLGQVAEPACGELRVKLQKFFHAVNSVADCACDIGCQIVQEFDLPDRQSAATFL
jgi:hypothetical protein